MKMTKIEKKLIDFIREYVWVFVIIIGLVGGIAARMKGLPFESDDYTDYVKLWVQTLKENGGFKGLCLDFYDYYIPYMLILVVDSFFGEGQWLLGIKIVSIFFEIVFAAVAALIAKKLLAEAGKDVRWASAVFAIFMISPMIVLDGAFWAQSDYIYCSFALLSVYFLLEEKYTLAINMLAISYTFKQQALLMLPLFLIVWLCNKKFSIVKFVYIPIWYYIAGIPAILAGKSPEAVYTIYKNQASGFDQLSMNLPNLYRFFPNLNKDEFFTWGIFATTVIFAVLGLWVMNNKYYLSNQAILSLCLCSTGICGMFLPAFHERYLALYVAFAYLYCLIYDKKKTVIPGVLDVLCCITYFLYLYGVDKLADYPIFAAIHLLILFYFIYDATRIIRKTCKKWDEVETESAEA